ncbi:sensor histidine kinase [Dawidia soli]|uniref:Histidine kinase n=1 Tax=Dawidia soli TaxID=2782352 RepID=A0AAP2GJD7_9BACT|nr:histidine kinase [Dawidia soli]MBT1689301.1 histidine kinase [Dawidia soli]
MKIRFRTYEVVFVSLLATASIIKFLWIRQSLTDEMKQWHALQYQGHNIAGFSYNHNILFPQIAQIVFVYLAYLAISGVMVYTAQYAARFKRNALRIIPIVLLLLAGIGFMLARGIDYLTWVAHPHVFNYGGAGFDVLAWFGYNDRPMTYIWTGFDRALTWVGMLAALLAVREGVIHYLERESPGKETRMILANQIASIISVYLCLLPLIILLPSTPGKHALMFMALSFIPSALLMTVFNLYYVFPRLSLKSGWWILAVLLTASLVTPAPFFIVFGNRGNIIHIHSAMVLINLFVISPISWLLFQQRKDKLLAIVKVGQALTKSREELNSLRYQINPHFLFNSLNTLYGNALMEKATTTASGIQQLGDMMRFMLHQNQLDFIPLKSELGYMRNFIALQNLRTHLLQNVDVQIDIHDDACDGDIPPMILIPFVENAFKHGISNVGKSWVAVTVRCERNHVYLNVRNSVHPDNIVREKSGVGIPNVVERLTLMFGDKFQLEYGIRGNEYVVSLTLPLTAA